VAPAPSVSPALERSSSQGGVRGLRLSCSCRPREAAEGQCYDLAHRDGNGRRLDRHPCGSEDEVEDGSANEELQGELRVGCHVPDDRTTGPLAEGSESASRDADEDQHAPYQKQGRTENGEPCVVNVHRLPGGPRRPGRRARGGAVPARARVPSRGSS
jgi:hypothetical protein